MKKIIFVFMLTLMSTTFASQNKGEKALKLGDQISDISLAGKKLSQYLKDNKVLFVVYRGGWCPYCVKQLKSYEKNLNRFKSHNIKIIAIAPELEKNVRKTKAKNDISFLMVSDKDHKVLRELNLVFKLDDETVKKYKGYGIDLVENQGNNKNELPIPATYLIDQDRKIIYSFVEFDYKQRASVDDILSSIEDKK